MAEIKIKKKKPVWPWILLGIIIIAILYFLLQSDNDGDELYDEDDIEMRENNNANDSASSNEAVMLSEMTTSEINEYTKYLSDSKSMGIDHNYSNAVLSKLIDATEALSNSLNIDINEDLSQARAQTADILKDPLDADHANKIKKAGNTIVKALKTIQSQKFPDLNENHTELQNALMAIDVNTLTLNQKQDIKNFFQEAGELLTNMKNQ